MRPSLRDGCSCGVIYYTLPQEVLRTQLVWGGGLVAHEDKGCRDRLDVGVDVSLFVLLGHFEVLELFDVSSVENPGGLR